MSKNNTSKGRSPSVKSPSARSGSGTKNYWLKFFCISLLALSVKLFLSLQEANVHIQDLEAIVEHDQFHVAGGAGNLVPNVWHEITPKSVAVPHARLAHAATSVGDHVYVFGGCYGSDPLKVPYQSFADMWIYTEHTDTWDQVAQLGNTPSPRLYHSLIDMDDKTLLLFGGFNVFQTVAGHTGLGDFYSFDVTTSTWTRLDTIITGEAPSARGAHAAIAYMDSMYMFGGFSAIGPKGHLQEMWKYSLTTRSWSKLPVVNGPEGRIGFSFVMVSDRVAYVTSGGCSVEVNPMGQCDSIWQYTPKTNEWMPVTTPGQPSARRATNADVSVAGIVYQYGGLFMNGTTVKVFGDLHALDVETHSWMPLFPNFNRGPNPPASFGHSLVRIENRLVLFGGRTNNAAQPGSNQLWEYTTIPHL